MIKHVSDTALWVATYRANETIRRDALFHDPLADRLAGKEGREFARQMRGSRYAEWSVVIRTCMIDDYIRKLVGKGIDSVLNLGAGLDTRPYRLDFDLSADLTWYEVDFPHLIEFKEERLRGEMPRVHLTRIKMDLSARAARQKLFADVSKSSRGGGVLVLTEGVVPYLSENQVAELAVDLCAQSGFRYWILDYYTRKMARYFRARGMRRQLKNAPLQFFPQDWTGFFDKVGWGVKEIKYYMAESERLGRPIPLPWWARVMLPLTRASAKESFQNISGYALLEPKKKG